jgi:hypothetical protein
VDNGALFILDTRSCWVNKWYVFMNTSEIMNTLKLIPTKWKTIVS